MWSVLGVFHYEKFISNSIDLMKYLLQGLYNLPNYTKRSGLLQIQKRIPNTIMKHPMLFIYKTERNLPYLNHCLRLSIRCLEKLTIQGFLLACPHFLWNPWKQDWRWLKVLFYSQSLMCKVRISFKCLFNFWTLRISSLCFQIKLLMWNCNCLDFLII